MRWKSAYLSAMLILGGCAAAAAGPIADAGQRAEQLHGEGKTVEALDALNQAIDAIWVDAPLAFRRVTLVEDAEGAAVERADRTFRPDEKLSVQVEPIGFGYGDAGGVTRIGFKGDLAIENATGQILTEARDLFDVSVESAPKRREFGMTLSFPVPYIRPGEYVARFTIRDQNSPKTGSFEVPFTVAPPAPPVNEAPPAQAEAPNPAEPGQTTP